MRPVLRANVLGGTATWTPGMVGRQFVRCHHLPFRSGMCSRGRDQWCYGWCVGGERCLPGCTPAGRHHGWRPPVPWDRTARVPHGLGSTGFRRSETLRGGAGGAPDHPAAMIASNSARNHSWSARISARNSSWAGSVDAVTTITPSPLPSPLLRGQTLIACRSWPLLAIVILRGLACSATGIRRVNTPAS